MSDGDLPERLVELEDLATWLRSLPTPAANFAYRFSEHLSIGDSAPNADAFGIDTKTANEIRRRLRREWGRRVWGPRS
jgi:hypothetical protein